MRVAFGETLMKLADKDERIVLLTGDVEQEMNPFKEKYPNRFFNLGLTEQAITSMAAGLAIEGYRPIVYSITPFVIERPYEQVKIDIDEQNAGSKSLVIESDATALLTINDTIMTSSVPIDTPDVETATISARDGTLAQTIAQSTGATTFVSGAVLVAPALGTPASGVLTNCTGLPLAGLTNAAKMEAIGIACGDETTVTAVATGVTEFQMPYGFECTSVRATVTTAPTTDAGFTIDINDDGTSILLTKITLDATEKTSTSAVTAFDFVASASSVTIADGSVITIDVDAASTGATEAGLKVWLIGYQT